MNRLMELLKAAGCTVPSDATLEQLNDLAMDAIGEGKLKAADWKAAKKEHLEYETKVNERIDAIADRVLVKMKAAQDAEAAAATETVPATETKTKTKSVDEPPTAEELAAAKIPSEDEMEAYVDARLKAMLGGAKPRGTDGASVGDQVLAAGAKAHQDKQIRADHKKVAERFSSERQTAVFKSGPRAGRPVSDEGRAMFQASDLDNVACGVWCKVQAGLPMTEQDTQIFEYMLKELPWVGYDAKRVSGRKLTEHEQAEIKSHYGMGGYDPTHPKHRDFKDLIDETGGSGAGHAVPEVYDDQLIILPILTGEILQYVNLINLPRGSALEGATVANPTFTWGGVAIEGTTLTEITTTSFIADYTIPVFRTAARIDMGQDWMEDALPNMFGQIQDRFRVAHLNDLGVQVAEGDGTTQPQGYKNASGIVAVTPTNPNGQPAVADFANLLFGVTKAYKFKEGQASGASAVFSSNETRYKQARQIQIGSGDNRYHHGPDLESYMLYGHPNVIDDTGMAMTDYAFLQAKGYRLVRRRGLRFRRADTGFTPYTTNLTTLVADARYGGKMERGGYCALISNLGMDATST